jgi:3-hydroxyisobutyrate dehydrogenase-like beta-hydroxyacid dehydrogenase
MTTPKTVGFIGLGAMGGALAASVAKGGFDLLVHDLNPVAVESLIAAGARRADSAEQLARESDVVLLSLPMTLQPERAGVEFRVPRDEVDNVDAL